MSVLQLVGSLSARSVVYVALSLILWIGTHTVLKQKLEVCKMGRLEFLTNDRISLATTSFVLTYALLTVFGYVAFFVILPII